MSCSEQKKNGLKRFLVGDDLDQDRYSIHVSKRAPGESAHEPHTHAGIEAFYIMQGQATVKTGQDEFTLHADEAIVINANKPHTITNNGTEPNRYAVVSVTR